MRESSSQRRRAPPCFAERHAVTSLPRPIRRCHRASCRCPPNHFKSRNPPHLPPLRPRRISGHYFSRPCALSWPSKMGDSFTGESFGADGDDRRRGVLQYFDDGVPGAADRSFVPGADRGDDLPGDRQLRGECARPGKPRAARARVCDRGAEPDREQLARGGDARRLSAGVADSRHPGDRYAGADPAFARQGRDEGLPHDGADRRWRRRCSARSRGRGWWGWITCAR